MTRAPDNTSGVVGTFRFGTDLGRFGSSVKHKPPELCKQLIYLCKEDSVKPVGELYSGRIMSVQMGNFSRYFQRLHDWHDTCIHRVVPAANPSHVFNWKFGE